MTAEVQQQSVVKRVGVPGLFILALFALFNAVYWPVRLHQQEMAPENFLAHAMTLYKQGARDAARQWLKDGIAAFHPVDPGPYETLLQWEPVGSADWGRYEAAAGFHKALLAAPEGRGALLQQAARKSLALLAVPHLSPTALKTAATFAAGLGGAWGVDEAVAGFSPEERYALLRLGGELSENGEVGGTGVKIRTDILASSGGGPAGRQYTHIFLRGRDYASDKRGFHVVLLDPRSGQVVQTGQFDVWDTPEDAQRMTRFLREAAAGVVGVFAVADDASGNMDEELEEALRAFGMERRTSINRTPAMLGLRWSFAAIGVKGAQAGTSLQVWSPERFQGYPGRAVVCGVICPLEAGR